MIDVNKLEFKRFPGGELHLTDAWTKDGRVLRDTTVICRVKESDDFIKLCLFVDAFKSVTGKMPERLVLPYIPYARQDRRANYGEALSIKVFANLINSLQFNEVLVLDPHSDVCTALIENVRIIPQWEIFADTIFPEVDLIAPDAGALKKIYKLQEAARAMGVNVPIRTATKHRDTQTGVISDTTIDGQPTHKVAIAVDDICDGGGTFLGLAKAIKPQYDKLILMVTHGIFSKGLSELSQYYDRILSTNSWNGELKAEGPLRVISVEKFLN